MKPFLIALAFARALDVTSTCVGLDRGAQEMNPILPGSCRQQIGIQAGLTVVQLVALRHVNKTHPRLAKVLGSVAIGVEVGAFVNNVHVIRGL